jgi:hypothetical protein
MILRPAAWLVRLLQRLGHPFLVATFLCILVLRSSALFVHMSSKSSAGDSPIRRFSFCRSCPSPAEEGSVAAALAPKFGIRDYYVTGQLVYGIPNHAELKKILNPRQIKNRIVFIDRGKNSFLEKVTKIQTYGAAAVIIADDGRCSSSFSYCGFRAGSLSEGGFASFDDEVGWSKITIPCVLVTVDVAEKLRLMMHLKEIEVPKVGYNNATYLDEYGNRDFFNEL